MMAFFYFMLIISCIGWFMGNRKLWAWLFYNHNNSAMLQSVNSAPRIWVAVKKLPSTTAHIKVTSFGNPAKRLASDIEIITNGGKLAESYKGYSYRQILAMLTPEQVETINELRSFLK